MNFAFQNQFFSFQLTILETKHEREEYYTHKCKINVNYYIIITFFLFKIWRFTFKASRDFSEYGHNLIPEIIMGFQKFDFRYRWINKKKIPVFQRKFENRTITFSPTFHFFWWLCILKINRNSNAVANRKLTRRFG